MGAAEGTRGRAVLLGEVDGPKEPHIDLPNDLLGAMNQRHHNCR